ncbi:MAG: hypothetical protein ABIK79_16615 [Chloroflexota bacterium]|nr:YckD family protein [Anaerolineae bacterium]
MKRVLTIGTTTLVVALLGLFVIGTVFAQDPTPTRQTPWGHVGGNIRRGFAMVHDTISELLGLTPEEIRAEREAGKSLPEIAAEQGFSEEDLNEAFVNARAEALQEAVESGSITQEQADRMMERMEAMPGLKLDHGSRPLYHEECAPGTPMVREPVHDTVSDLLGLTPEELHAEIQDGKSLAEIAAERGISAEELTDALLEAKAEMLREAVANEQITQEQADLMMERFESQIESMLNGTIGSCGPTWGRRGGMRPGNRQPVPFRTMSSELSSS